MMMTTMMAMVLLLLLYDDDDDDVNGGRAVDDEPCGCAAGTFSSQLRTRCFLIIFPRFASTADHCGYYRDEDHCDYCGEDHYDCSFILNLNHTLTLQRMDVRPW